MDLQLLLELNEYDLTQIDNPDWKEYDLHSRHIHDWRKYIPYGVRLLWQMLNTETAQMAYYMAKQIADHEYGWEI